MHKSAVGRASRRRIPISTPQDSQKPKSSSSTFSAFSRSFNQFTLAVAVTKFKTEFFFLRGTVHRIREVSSFVLHMRYSTIYFIPELIAPCFKNQLEMRQLGGVHILFAWLLLVRLYPSDGENAQGRGFTFCPSCMMLLLHSYALSKSPIGENQAAINNRREVGWQLFLSPAWQWCEGRRIWRATLSSNCFLFSVFWWKHFVQ